MGAKAKYPTKRIEVKTARGIVAMVRYGEARRPGSSYRVSYQYGADHWAEYCLQGDGRLAYRAFASLVRFQRNGGTTQCQA